jgi:hypothetical protein
MDNVFANAIENVKNIKSSDPKEQYVKKITKTAKGCFAGMVGGLMLGWYFKKNLYVYALIGTLVGGGINYMLLESEV